MPWFQHDDVTMISPGEVTCGDAIFEIEGCPAPRTAWRICVDFFEWPQDMVNLGTSILGPQQV